MPPTNPNHLSYWENEENLYRIIPLTLNEPVDPILYAHVALQGWRMGESRLTSHAGRTPTANEKLTPLPTNAFTEIFYTLNTSTVWGTHYLLGSPHLQMRNGRPTGLILYTPNPDYAKSDRVVASRPGRWLTRMANGLMTHNTIQRLAELINAELAPELYELKWATTADEIEEIYANGPRSCMSGYKDDWATGKHPARAYATAGVAVAYIADEADRIIARAVVNTARKTFYNTYGDGGRLRTLLEDEGYTHDPSFLAGAELPAIDADGEGAILCPYIDGEHNLWLNEARGVIEVRLPDEEGNGGSSTCGYFHRDICCVRCGRHAPPDQFNGAILNCDPDLQICEACENYGSLARHYHPDGEEVCYISLRDALPLYESLHHEHVRRDELSALGLVEAHWPTPHNTRWAINPENPRIYLCAGCNEFFIADDRCGYPHRVIDAIEGIGTCQECYRREPITATATA